MIRLIIILTITLALQNGCTVAQSTTSASPSPTPATKRPMLDQFGLSNGVFANKESTASTANTEPKAKVEYVDQHIFETLSVLIEKSVFMEAELSRALSDNVDISPDSRFRKYFEHHIGGLINGSEVQRTGMFGGEGIKNGELTKLLQKNEETIDEIIAVLNTSPVEYAKYSKELNGISEKYGVPVLENPAAGTRLDKPALLKAMMAKINANYARVKKQMAVRK